jgi:AAA family ATP:ADP antiporter
LFTLNEAKENYPILNNVSNVGILISGLFIEILSQSLIPGGNLVSLLVITQVLFSVLGIYIYIYWSSKVTSVYNNQNCRQIKNILKEERSASPFREVLTSKIVYLICLPIIGYGISINLLESIWKKYVTIFHCSAEQYIFFIGRCSVLSGTTIVITGFILRKAVKDYGWLRASLASPILFIVLTTILFILLFSDNLTPIGFSYLGVFFISLIKSLKYSLSDSTKEMVYISLPPALKSIGKSIADIIGGRLGKSGGGIIQQFLFILTGLNIIELASSFFIIILVFCFLWIFSVYALHKRLEILN